MHGDGSGPTDDAPTGSVSVDGRAARGRPAPPFLQMELEPIMPTPRLPRRRWPGVLLLTTSLIALAPALARADEATLWDTVKLRTQQVFALGGDTVHSLYAWLAGFGGESRLAEELLAFSNKDLRDLELLVDSAGYRLEDITIHRSAQSAGNGEVTLSFAWQRAVDTRHKAELRDIIARDNALVDEDTRTIVGSLLDASQRAQKAPNERFQNHLIQIRLAKPPEVAFDFQAPSAGADHGARPHQTGIAGLMPAVISSANAATPGLTPATITISEVPAGIRLASSEPETDPDPPKTVLEAKPAALVPTAPAPVAAAPAAKPAEAIPAAAPEAKPVAEPAPAVTPAPAAATTTEAPNATEAVPEAKPPADIVGAPEAAAPIKAEAAPPTEPAKETKAAEPASEAKPEPAPAPTLPDPAKTEPAKPAEPPVPEPGKSSAAPAAFQVAEAAAEPVKAEAPKPAEPVVEAKPEPTPAAEPVKAEAPKPAEPVAEAKPEPTPAAEPAKAEAPKPAEPVAEAKPATFRATLTHTNGRAGPSKDAAKLRAVSPKDVLVKTGKSKGKWSEYTVNGETGPNSKVWIYDTVVTEIK